MATSTSTLLRSASIATALIFTLAACGNDGSDTDAAAQTQNGSTSYPLEVESCGIKQTFEEPLSRVAALTSTARETMLDLGLEDVMVGTAYLRGREIGPQYAEAYDDIPVLAAGQPSMEKLLSVDPDFVYAGYGDGFSESYGHTREDLDQLGINTHLSPVGCTDKPKKLSDETDELATIGKIFDVNDAAEKAIDKFESKVSEVADTVDGADRPTVFLYNSGEDAPTTVGGWAYASVMIEAAGGENIFADEDLRWGKVSWEQVAAADPDIILIYDYLEPSVKSKIATLKKTPAIKDTTAITEGNIAEISLSLAQPGPRSAEGIEELARQFHPELYSDD